MTEQQTMTRKELEQEMQRLSGVFASVRLLEAEQAQAVSGPVKNALEEQVRKSRLEYADGVLQQVTACPLLVDGRPCVLELVQNLDEEQLLDSEESEQLLGTITDQRERRYRDSLTGAYNRQYYEEIYRDRLLTAGVAMLDLDDFRLANDVYGHYAGDSALETAVNVVRRCLDEKDRLIRYGGDELLLILPEIGQKELSQKLEQIRLQLYTASVPGYSHIRISASIGGVWVRETPAHTAVQRAVQLLQYARLQKNTVITEQEPAQRPDAQLYRRQSVLIVDDSAMNRKLLSDMLGQQFDTAEAASGEEGLHLLEQNPTGISIVLLGVHLTGMDGFTVLEAMNHRHLLEEIPVIVISSEDGVDTVRRAFDLGASDYISRPFDAKVVYQRISNTIRLYAKQRRLSAMAADQAYEKEKNSRMIIDILSQVVEKRDGESREHVRRVSVLTEMLLAHLAQKTDRYLLTREVRRTISTAAALHDIGKMEISDSLLYKAPPLTAEEMQLMRSHTLLGAKMLEQLEAYKEEGFVRVAYQICRWHHERYDGGGYPDGLAGEQIPLAAQVVGLADVYERLVSKPVDGQARPHREAIRMICAGECGVFNPLLLDCLRDIEAEINTAMHAQPDTL